MNSRKAGKNGELELAGWLRDQGVEAKRGWMQGKDITHALPGIHIECKVTGVLRLYEWMEQADRDARLGEIPVILHRKKNKKPFQKKNDWVAILDAGDFVALLGKAGIRAGPSS